MADIWPGDIRCVAMLTFDVDGVSGLINRFPQAPQHPSLMSLGEFGPRVGTPRILELLDKYNIKASFFIPGYVAEEYPALVRDIVRRGHEVGHHGYMHEPPSTLSPSEEAEVLDKGIDILESLTGERPKGYRSPGWELSQHSLDYLSQRAFLYDSSLMENDVPYFVESSHGRLVELPVQWFLDDVPYYVFLPVMGRRGRLPGVEEVYENWAAEFDGAYRFGRAFMLTMHPGSRGVWPRS